MDAQRELMCCMFTFSIPQTQHVCFEAIFGQDLAPPTIKHLQHLSLSNAHLKVVLDSKQDCRYIRPAVTEYVQRLFALQQSLKRASTEGYNVRVAKLPKFEWSSALEQKNCCDEPVKYTDPTIAFQLVQSLFTFAVAGNANEAPHLLKDVLSIDEVRFKDIVREVKKRLLTAAGILHFISKEVLPQWRPGVITRGGCANDSEKARGKNKSKNVVIPLECCPKFLEALAHMFEAQAYQVTIALKARTTSKKEVLAKVCLGITKRYQQALEALHTLDPNGVRLIERIRPSLKVYLESMRFIVNGVAVMFLAEAAVKPQKSSASDASQKKGATTPGSLAASLAASAKAKSKSKSGASTPTTQRPDMPKAYALFLRAQKYATIAQDLVFHAATWHPRYSRWMCLCVGGAMW